MLGGQISRSLRWTGGYLCILKVPYQFLQCKQIITLSTLEFVHLVIGLKVSIHCNKIKLAGIVASKRMDGNVAWTGFF